MATLLITNKIVTNKGTLTVIKRIIDDWVLAYEPSLTNPETVIIDGHFLGWDYSIDSPKKRQLKEFTGKCKLNQEQFDIWKNSGFEVMVLLLMLVVDKPETDDYESIAWDFHTTATDWLLRAIIPNCCACGNPDDALVSVDRVMSTFGNYPGGVSDISIYDNGADLTVAYQIDARNKFISHGGSIGSSWLGEIGVIWSLAAMMVIGGNQRTKLEALPEPIKKLNYPLLQTINGMLTFIGFMNYCIDEIEAGTSTYEELWDEEGGHEESGCMWYIYSRNKPPKESIKDIHEDIKREYGELMEYCGTKNWEDTKLVLSKVSNFNLKGLRFHYGE